MIDCLLWFIAGGSLGFMIASIVFAADDEWEDER